MINHFIANNYQDVFLFTKIKNKIVINYVSKIENILLMGQIIGLKYYKWYHNYVKCSLEQWWNKPQNDMNFIKEVNITILDKSYINKNMKKTLSMYEYHTSLDNIKIRLVK